MGDPTPRKGRWSGAASKVQYLVHYPVCIPIAQAESRGSVPNSQLEMLPLPTVLAHPWWFLAAHVVDSRYGSLAGKH